MKKQMSDLRCPTTAVSKFFQQPNDEDFSGVKRFVQVCYIQDVTYADVPRNKTLISGAATVVANQ